MTSVSIVVFNAAYFHQSTPPSVNTAGQLRGLRNVFVTLAKEETS